MKVGPTERIGLSLPSAGGEAGAAIGVAREQVAQVDVDELAVMLRQRVPGRRADGAAQFMPSSTTFFSAWPPNCLRIADWSLFA